MDKVHLDTDLGGDIDDLCALAMLLRWPDDIELTGITVVGDTQGKRTGAVRYVLGLEGRNEIPVAAGADTSQGFYPYELGLPPEERYWPQPIIPSPNAPEEAIRLLKQSIEQGATIIGIGPYTNLYLLELQHPGILMQARLFLMGGYIYPPRPGFPQWRNQDDFNIQVDVRSAKHVLQNSNPTLIPLSVTAETALRRIHLEPLRLSGGVLGQLIAKQAEEFAIDEQMDQKYAASYERVAADIINFQHDALACAVALGWREGIWIEELPLLVEERDGWLTERIDPAGKPFRVVTKVDGPRFDEFWLDIAGRDRGLLFS
ncbi:MAG: nucleoside hydrolase [Caldilineaceae bacterium]|nr:nucleoside hydrolase [Caldilineaceae bacterium]